MGEFSDVIIALNDAFAAFCPPVIIYIGAGFMAFYSLFKLLREVK